MYLPSRHVLVFSPAFGFSFVSTFTLIYIIHVTDMVNPSWRSLTSYSSYCGSEHTSCVLRCHDVYIRNLLVVCFSHLGIDQTIGNTVVPCAGNTMIGFLSSLEIPTGWHTYNNPFEEAWLVCFHFFCL